MIRNYLTIALRSLRRNLGSTIINVLGLALGLTASIVLFMLIRFWSEFDNYHPDVDRLYRVVHASGNMGREDFGAGVPAPFVTAVKEEFSGIESALFISGQYEGLLTVEVNGQKKNFAEGMFAYADGTYFKMFHRPLLEGSAPLTAPNEAVVSKKLATKLFGAESPINKTFRLDNRRDVRITAIMEDFPQNTSFPFDLILSYETIRAAKEEEGWGSVYSDDQCYVKLEPGTTAASVNDQFIPFVEKHFRVGDGFSLAYTLQPLSDLNHDTRFNNYRFSTIGKNQLWAMGVIAFFLMVTASINFINLTTAVAARRSREVGVRKVMGSQRFQLVTQFLNESGLVTLLAMVLSLGLAELTLIRLNSFLTLDLHINLGSAELWLFLAFVFVFVTLLSGLYPSLVISRLKPVEALKNKLTNRGSGGFILRRSLIVFQFIISNFMIIGMMVLISQQNYLRSKDLGFSRDAILTVPLPDTQSKEKKQALKQQVASIAGVEQVSLCTTPPSSGSVSVSDFRIAGKDQEYLTQIKLTDEAYQELFGLKLIAGKWLDASDTIRSVVVNERLLRETGIEAEDMIGREMTIWGRTRPVVGVVADYHTMTLERPIDPTIMMSLTSGYYCLAIKLTKGNWTETLQEIEKVWNTHYGDYMYSYKFVDQEIEEFYESERKMSTLFSVFTGLAIAIGCIGLFGLVSYMASEKEKEIGVRKVLGASVPQIVYLFSKEFVILITVAFIIATPLAGYMMDSMLSQFAYHTQLGWPVFAVSLIVSLAIAFATVGYKSIRAALANPVNSLRSE